MKRLHSQLKGFIELVSWLAIELEAQEDQNIASMLQQ